MVTPTPPTFLNALDNLGLDGRGWWTANCPICTCDGMTVTADQEQHEWIFTCPDGCPNEEVVGWLQADTRLDAEVMDRWATRAWMALMLAPTIEIWEALLAGEEVVEERLDQKWVERFRQIGALN